MRAYLRSILPSVSSHRLRVSQMETLNSSRFPHTDVLCNEPCKRPRPCGHSCLEACYSTCRCICSNDRDAVHAARIVEDLPVKKPHSKTHSGSQSRVHQFPPLPSSSTSQRSRHEIKQSVQAYQDFAKGGHVEADKKIAANAKEQAAVATDEETLERLRILDEQTAVALFGEVPSPSPPKASPKKEDAKSVRHSADGKRIFRWEDTFVLGGSSEEKAKEPERSLLD